MIHLFERFCKDHNVEFVVRGLRDGKDLDYEKVQAEYNHVLSDEPAKLKYGLQFLSCLGRSIISLSIPTRKLRSCILKMPKCSKVL